MNNFIFSNPTKIVFGEGQIAKLSNLIDKDSKIMITYGGGSIFKNGIYDQVKTALSGFNTIEFGGIEANPQYSTLLKGVELAEDNSIDFLLAVGGGSVLDGTKFIAAALNYEGDDKWDIPTGAGVIKSAVPVGAVITLPATGSEMNGNAVISRKETAEKYGFASNFIYPQFSILDPSCIASLPERQIANGIVDSYVHTMEQYLTVDLNTPLQDRFAEGILQTIIEEGPKVLKDPKDIKAAGNFMWSATWALNNWISQGVVGDWSTHVIGHEITALAGLDHARTLAIVLPGVMTVMSQEKKQRLIQYGERIWDVRSGTEEERITAAIYKTVKFFESVGIQTKFSDYDISPDVATEIIERFKKRGSALGENGIVTVDKIEEILMSRL